MHAELIAGVDYSGARDEPHTAWLAVGKLDGLGLEILDLKEASGPKLPMELAKLTNLKVVGLDFPFSLPVEFIESCAVRATVKPFQSWQEVVEHFVFVSFDDFVALAREFKQEPGRITDNHHRGLAQSPLKRNSSSSGQGMVHVTYQGMRLLAGLDPAHFAVLPFADRSESKCSVIEVFSRGTLSCLGLPDSGYKSKERKDADRVAALRKEILEGLIGLREKRGITFRDFPRLNVEKRFHHAVIESDHALDAIIACYTAATWQSAPEHFEDPFDCDDEAVLLEGWIYAPMRVREPKA